MESVLYMESGINNYILLCDYFCSTLNIMILDCYFCIAYSAYRFVLGKNKKAKELKVLFYVLRCFIFLRVSVVWGLRGN